MIVCVTGIMFRLMTTWILSSKAASLVDRALELGGVVSGYQKDDLSTNFVLSGVFITIVKKTITINGLVLSFYV